MDKAAGEPIRIDRNCIVCNSDDYKNQFDFTFDFLKNVRGHEENRLRLRGWTEDVTSTIVKCNECGCHYIRDVIIPSVEFFDSFSINTRIEDYKKRTARKETFQNYKNYDDNHAVVRVLLFLAARLQKRDIRFLDFGAGNGGISSMARSYGISEVVAYDPLWVDNIQELFDSINLPGIRCVRSKEELPALGPFDAVVFKSAIEHVVDPRGELQTIFDLMSPGGYLYVNNPVMDLDKELDQLRNAKQIVKKDQISYYHVEHFNYMMPKHFSRLVKDVGFTITPLAQFAPVPLAKGMLGSFLLRNIKCTIRILQNTLGIPYKRYFYILQKPL